MTGYDNQSCSAGLRHSKHEDVNSDLEDKNNPLALNPGHARACHDRWIKQRHNIYPLPEGEDYPEEWYNDQCGGYRFYILLNGVDAFNMDWGVCSNPASVSDGRVMFEHDGCDACSPAEKWISEYF
jgi:hypothetical protein